MIENTALYIHIPFCLSRCKYCDFFSQTEVSQTLLDAYISALCNEIKFRKDKLSIKTLKTIYIGGGTPSLLSISNIKNLFSFLKTLFPLNNEMEITIEVNPDDINEQLLQSYKDNEINRLSCGIQSMNDRALQFACRRASASENRRVLNLLSEKWGKTLSLDLICGLPCETQESFMAGLQEIISFNPNHISMYSLTIEDETPFGKMLNSGKLKYDFEFADELWLKGKNFLEKNGYHQYEVSNFAKKGFESRHNLFYWNHKDYIGCGSGASGSIYDDDGRGLRWTNSSNLYEYIKFWSDDNVFEREELPQVSEKIDLENSIFEFFMMGLRKVDGVKESEFEMCFHQNIPSKIFRNFEKWEKEGLCKIINKDDDRVFTLGENGLLFLNRFLEEIL